VLTSVLVGAVSLFFLFKKTGKLFPIDLKEFKKSFSLAKWIFISSCLVYAFHRLGTIFLTRYSSYNDLGIYSAAFQLVFTVSFMIGSLAGVFLPRASKALESKEKFKHYVRESLIASTGINFFIIVLIIIAPFVVNLLYGPDYQSATLILRILLVGWFVFIYYLPFSYLFYALEESKILFFIELFRLLAAIILLYFLVPRFNMLGAAFGQSLVFIATSILGVIILKTRLGLKNKLAGLKTDGSVQ
jgi:O-antigen/teichoic acid export membrane protein